MLIDQQWIHKLLCKITDLVSHVKTFLVNLNNYFVMSVLLFGYYHNDSFLSLNACCASGLHSLSVPDWFSLTSIHASGLVSISALHKKQAHPLRCAWTLLSCNYKTNRVKQLFKFTKNILTWDIKSVILHNNLWIHCWSINISFHLLLIFMTSNIFTKE